MEISAHAIMATELRAACLHNSPQLCKCDAAVALHLTTRTRLSYRTCFEVLFVAFTRDSGNGLNIAGVVENDDEGWVTKGGSRKAR